MRLSDNEFLRLREEIITPDVFLASKKLREQQYFQREDGTPLHYTLVNLKNWCKNDFEVISQLKINTENSNQRFDVILLLNGLPLVQIELKNLTYRRVRRCNRLLIIKMSWEMVMAIPFFALCSCSS